MIMYLAGFFVASLPFENDGRIPFLERKAPSWVWNEPFPHEAYVLRAGKRWQQLPPMSGTSPIRGRREYRAAHRKANRYGGFSPNHQMRPPNASH
jgi:hypothetical protein